MDFWTTSPDPQVCDHDYSFSCLMKQMSYVLGPLYFENGTKVLETAWYLINTEWPSLSFDVLRLEPSQKSSSSSSTAATKPEDAAPAHQRANSIQLNATSPDALAAEREPESPPRNYTGRPTAAASAAASQARPSASDDERVSEPRNAAALAKGKRCMSTPPVSHARAGAETAPKPTAGKEETSNSTASTVATPGVSVSAPPKGRAALLQEIGESTGSEKTNSDELKEADKVAKRLMQECGLESPGEEVRDAPPAAAKPPASASKVLHRAATTGTNASGSRRAQGRKREKQSSTRKTLELPLFGTRLNISIDTAFAEGRFLLPAPPASSPAMPSPPQSLQQTPSSAKVSDMARVFSPNSRWAGGGAEAGSGSGVDEMSSVLAVRTRTHAAACVHRSYVFPKFALCPSLSEREVPGGLFGNWLAGGQFAAASSPVQINATSVIHQGLNVANPLGNLASLPRAPMGNQLTPPAVASRPGMMGAGSAADSKYELSPSYSGCSPVTSTFRATGFPDDSPRDSDAGGGSFTVGGVPPLATPMPGVASSLPRIMGKALGHPGLAGGQVSPRKHSVLYGSSTQPNAAELQSLSNSLQEQAYDGISRFRRAKAGRSHHRGECSQSPTRRSLAAHLVPIPTHIVRFVRV